MSQRATNWAWAQKLPKSQKMVLLALAHCHNYKSGQCNPRISVLCDMTGSSKRPVQYALNDLVAANKIGKIDRRVRGRQASNHYFLNMEDLPFQGAENSRLDSDEEMSKSAPSKCQNQHPHIEQGIRKGRFSSFEVIDCGDDVDHQDQNSPHNNPDQYCEADILRFAENTKIDDAPLFTVGDVPSELRIRRPKLKVINTK